MTQKEFDNTAYKKGSQIKLPSNKVVDVIMIDFKLGLFGFNDGSHLKEVYFEDIQLVV